ncbi:MAG: hypothetical protein B0D92_07660 [Spirochaeta sp. LUC14_002_19_P3]|nr:MAG: hypothetical protein B0D92_07660 [Spirochaeta sp. LUC14_002_19_P3]
MRCSVRYGRSPESRKVMPDFKDMIVGERAEIVGYETGDKNYRKKLLAMGLTRGTEFTLTKVAPLGDPVEIEIRGYKLSLRKCEANILQLKKIVLNAEASSRGK